MFKDVPCRNYVIGIIDKQIFSFWLELRSSNEMRISLFGPLCKRVFLLFHLKYLLLREAFDNIPSKEGHRLSLTHNLLLFLAIYNINT